MAYSRFFSKTDSESQIETAFYLLKTDYYEKKVHLEDIIPRSEPYTYKFKVQNNDGEVRTETNLTYKLKIITTTNLPLNYKLYKNEDSTSPNSTNIITSDTIEKTSNNGAYFRTIETEEEQFTFTKDEENIYTLVITFPQEYDSFNYQDIVEGITINIDSKQVIEENP